MFQKVSTFNFSLIYTLGSSIFKISSTEIWLILSCCFSNPWYYLNLFPMSRTTCGYSPNYLIFERFRCASRSWGGWNSDFNFEFLMSRFRSRSTSSFIYWNGCWNGCWLCCKYIFPLLSRHILIAIYIS